MNHYLVTQGKGETKASKWITYFVYVLLTWWNAGCLIKCDKPRPGNDDDVFVPAGITMPQ